MRCHGWYVDPRTNTSTFLNFTKVWDYVRNRKTFLGEGVDEYIYNSNLDDVVVIDSFVKERRLYYLSESEDELDSPAPEERKRLSVYITLAVKYSAARYVLVGSSEVIFKEDAVAVPLEEEDDDVAYVCDEYDALAESVYRRLDGKKGFWR
jgi:hypothetical protein